MTMIASPESLAYFISIMYSNHLISSPLLQNFKPLTNPFKVDLGADLLYLYFPTWLHWWKLPSLHFIIASLFDCYIKTHGWGESLFQYSGFPYSLSGATLPTTWMLICCVSDLCAGLNGMVFFLLQSFLLFLADAEIYSLPIWNFFF